jgi:hypothetical protein
MWRRLSLASTAAAVLALVTVDAFAFPISPADVAQPSDQLIQVAPRLRSGSASGCMGRLPLEWQPRLGSLLVASNAVGSTTSLRLISALCTEVNTTPRTLRLPRRFQSSSPRFLVRGARSFFQFGKHLFPFWEHASQSHEGCCPKHARRLLERTPRSQGGA